MAKLSAFKADLDKETEGVWVPHNRIEGVEFKIASMHSEEYQETLKKLIDHRKALLEKTTLSEDEMEDVQKEAFSKAILKDWRGMDGDDGKPLAYTPAEGLKTFRDPECWRLWNFIFQESARELHFRKQALEQDTGN